MFRLPRRRFPGALYNSLHSIHGPTSPHSPGATRAAQPSGQPAGARPTYLLQGHRLRGRTRTSSPSGGCPLGCSPRRAPPAPALAPASPPRKHAFSSSPSASSVASRLAAASAWGDHHGTRWVPHARGRYVYARACARLHVQRVAGRAKLPCASGTCSAQQAGTCSPYVAHAGAGGRTWFRFRVGIRVCQLRRPPRRRGWGS